MIYMLIIIKQDITVIITIDIIDININQIIVILIQMMSTTTTIPNNITKIM